MVKKTEVIFFGTPIFSKVILENLIKSNLYNIKAVITQPDRIAGRKLQIQKSPVKLLAEEYNLKVLQPEKLRKESSKIITEIGNFDLAIVVAYGQIIPEDLLNLGLFINIHASILPRWRGAAPIQRAIIAGDKTTGIGLMKMTPRLDDGDVYCEAKIDLENLTYEQAHNKLMDLGSKLLLDNLSKIINNELLPTPQSLSGITYANKITNEEAKINWNNQSVDIFNLIRGLSPIPGAYTFIDEVRMKIFEAKILDKTSKNPGNFIINNNNNLEVETNDFNIELLEIQLAGKSKQSCANLLNGFKPKGNKFT